MIRFNNIFTSKSNPESQMKKSVNIKVYAMQKPVLSRKILLLLPGRKKVCLD